MDMLAGLKTKLGIQVADTSKDALLQDALADASTQAMEHCNLLADETLPDGLQRVIVSMARDLWRSEGYGQETSPQMVSSISDNGQSVSYKQNNQVTATTLIDAYAKQLSAYRRLRK